MGVSGAGKTRIGAALSSALGWPFFDADDFHSDTNVSRMRGGIALTDHDRVAWLQAIRAALARVDDASENAVLACSALGKQFRASLREGFDDMRFVYLKVDRELARARVASRVDHFMPAALVDSQFASLDEPEDALVIDASKPPDEIVAEILTGLQEE